MFYIIIYTHCYFCAVTVGCLILHQRYKKRVERYWTLANDVSSTFVQEQTQSPLIEAPNTSTHSFSNRICSNLPTINEGCCEESPVTDIEDLLSPSRLNDNNTPEEGLCPSRFGCAGPKRDVCQGVIQKYQEQQDEDIELIEEEPDSHNPQILRHIVLLILLLCSIFVVRYASYNK